MVYSPSSSFAKLATEAKRTPVAKVRRSVLGRWAGCVASTGGLRTVFGILWVACFGMFWLGCVGSLMCCVGDVVRPSLTQIAGGRRPQDFKVI